MTLRINKMVRAIPAVLVAQATGTPYTIQDFGGSVGLGTADLKTTVVNAVSWALGVLALVAVVFIIVGGFQWLTAAGNEERVELAKKTISSAVVGMVLVLMSWAIVTFIVNTTRNVTV
jgi:hypothetical protein